MPTSAQILESALQQQRSGDLGHAEALYGQILRLDPNHVLAMFHLGMLYQAQQRLNESIKLLSRAVRVQPDFVFAYNSLGVALAQQRKYEAAVDALQRAISLRPDLIDLHINLGNVRKSQEKFDLAMESYRAALRLNAGHAEAHNLMGSIHAMQGRLAEGLAHFEEALRLEPRNAVTHSNLILAMNYLPDIDPLTLLAEHRFWARLHGRGLTPPPVHTNSRDPNRKLRVGYVSPDFRRHAAAGFLEPIFRHHDPKKFEITAYAEVPSPDSITARFKALAHRWRFTCGQSDAQLAKQIREDGIDILVDLAGHSASNRLTMFAHMPAPVMVTYLGYPTTTGLPEMGYRLSDPVVDPPDETTRYTEEVIRLDGCFCCYAPPEDAPGVSALPSLKRDHITFGSLHNLAKLNMKTVDQWCSVLRAIPTSRMLVFRNTLQGARREQIQRLFVERGIVADRIELRNEAASPMDYLRVYDDVDIQLDAVPWSGHVTTCESLWMGVPMISLYGTRSAGRMSASILQAIGRLDWIAQTTDEFVAIAHRFSEDPAGLSHIRSTLRQQMRSSMLCDGDSFCRHMESEFRRLWEKWCRTSSQNSL